MFESLTALRVNIPAEFTEFQFFLSFDEALEEDHEGITQCPIKAV